MIEIPERMKRFPLYRGRFPIHFTVFVNAKGEPEFKVLSRARQVEAAAKNLCHLCGQRMTPLYYFIGGPLSMEHRHFIDGPMHKECAEYAAKACPFLSNTMAHYSKVEFPSSDRHILHNSQIAGTIRPERMCIAGTASYTSAVQGLQYPEFTAGEWQYQDWDTIPARNESSESPVTTGRAARQGGMIYVGSQGL